MTTALIPVTRSPLTLRAWDPFRDLARLDRARLDRAVEVALGSAADRSGTAPWRPAADVTEADDAFVVDLELPGVPREAVSVEVSGRSLRVWGEAPARDDEERGTVRVRGRRAGAFSFRAQLPVAVDGEAVTAELADGVLTVRAPKAASAVARRVEVAGR